MKVVEEIRRERLALLKERFGSFPALNKKLGRSSTDSTLSQIANQSIGSKTDKPKTMGSVQARQIEDALELERGWMDTDPALMPAGQSERPAIQDADAIARGLGMRLHSARTTKQMNIDQVAQHFHVSAATVDAWESGSQVPDAIALRSLARLYDVSADALLWEDSLSPEAMQFAAEFDSLNENQKRTLLAMWMAYIRESATDAQVEDRMAITKEKPKFVYEKRNIEPPLVVVNQQAEEEQKKED